MTADQKLRESLRAVAREAEVSEADRVHAWHRIVRRREQLIARRRMHGLVAAAVVGGLAVGGALGWRELAPEAQPAAEPEPAAQVVPVSVDALAGVWLTSDGSGSLWSFHHDGTVTWSEPGIPGARLDPGGPAVDYTLTDTGIDLPGDRCDWDLRITDDGRMTGTVTSRPESGEHRCADVQWRSWVRLSPRSEAGASLVWTGTDTAGQNAEAARMHRAPTPVGSVALISRTWLQQGTGRLLTITRADGDGDAPYVLDDGGELLTNPDDVGTVVLDDTGALVLTSSDESRGCPDGSVASFPEVVLRGTGGTYPPKPAPSLELTAQDGDCGLHHGLSGTWVQVSS